MKSLIQRVREILGGETHVEAEHDDAKVQAKTVAVNDASAPEPTRPAFTDSARNPAIPDRAAWGKLNAPDFTRHSFRVVRCGRGRDGRPVLFEVDVRDGRRIDDLSFTSFALEQPKK